jgi:hypothetical protein
VRIGVLTLSGSVYGLRLLNALKRIGQPVVLVLVLQDSLPRKLRLMRRVARQIGWLDTIWYALEYPFQQFSDQGVNQWRGEPLLRDYGRLAEEIVVTSSLRAQPVQTAVQRVQPDLVLLGQSGIVPQSLLALPRHGTFNAHPGLLPDYRGIDCHKWAIHQKDFSRVGSSLHFVDSKVDTGDILLRKPHKWTGQETVTTLLAALYEDCIDLLLEGVQCVQSGSYKPEPQVGGRYYHKMPRRLLKSVDTNLHAYLTTGAYANPGQG